MLTGVLKQTCTLLTGSESGTYCTADLSDSVHASTGSQGSRICQDLVFSLSVSEKREKPIK